MFCIHWGEDIYDGMDQFVRRQPANVIWPLPQLLMKRLYAERQHPTQAPRIALWMLPSAASCIGPPALEYPALRASSSAWDGQADLAAHDSNLVDNEFIRRPSLEPLQLQEVGHHNASGLEVGRVSRMPIGSVDCFPLEVRVGSVLLLVVCPP